MSSSARQYPVILLRHLSIKYPIYDRPSHKLLELLTFRRKQWHREFWALQDIDLEVDAGTTLGIIGQNGSGKSTLLQIIAGIHRQTRGDCYVHGTVSALLELGAGFNPEFTGRENVFMNGAILGFGQEQMERLLPDILDFAEIGDFIDQPVKTYSSGMFMRLAFAVAIHVDPDILLIDESLAVGDLIFQHRCTNRIRRLRDEGKTILFVTHDLQAVTRFCDRAVLLDQGRKLVDGSPDKVVQKYHSLIFERERRRAGEGQILQAAREDEQVPIVTTIPHIDHLYGEGGAEIIGVILLGEENQVVNGANPGEELQLIVSARFHRTVKHPIIGFTIRDRLGMELAASNTSYAGLDLPLARAGCTVSVAFKFKIPEIRPGSYSISPAVASGNIWEHQIEDWIDNAYILTINEAGLIYGLMKWPVKARFRTTIEEVSSDMRTRTS